MFPLLVDTNTSGPQVSALIQISYESYLLVISTEPEMMSEEYLRYVGCHCIHTLSKGDITSDIVGWILHKDSLNRALNFIKDMYGHTSHDTSHTFDESTTRYYDDTTSPLMGHYDNRELVLMSLWPESFPAYSEQELVHVKLTEDGKFPYSDKDNFWYETDVVRYGSHFYHPIWLCKYPEPFVMKSPSHNDDLKMVKRLNERMKNFTEMYKVDFKSPGLVNRVKLTTSSLIKFPPILNTKINVQYYNTVIPQSMSVESFPSGSH
jgi:hypothetical protein